MPGSPSFDRDSDATEDKAMSPNLEPNSPPLVDPLVTSPLTSSRTSDGYKILPFSVFAWEPAPGHFNSEEHEECYDSDDEALGLKQTIQERRRGSLILTSDDIQEIEKLQKWKRIKDRRAPEAPVEWMMSVGRRRSLDRISRVQEHDKGSKEEITSPKWAEARVDQCGRRLSMQTGWASDETFQAAAKERIEQIRRSSIS